MLTLKEYMELVNYRITEAIDCGWGPYGKDARLLDSWSGREDGNSISITFDTKTQSVYEAMAYDYSNNRVFHLFNSEFLTKYDNSLHNIDYIDYTKLYRTDDFVNKARAIIIGVNYDSDAVVFNNVIPLYFG